ncbi:MAG: hypothetical protein ABFC63_02745 [Thermoguttaceae bacterium]
MSPAKKQAPASPISTWLLGPGRPVLLLAVFLALACGVLLAIWHGGLGRRILGSSEYRLTAERVQITTPPEWIHTDIRAEVFRDPTLDGTLSLLDDDLAERVYRAFARHPWVAKVIRVDKHNLTVELIYRRPVCMVEVPGGLLPVDEMGTLLPTGDFSSNEAVVYPRLTGVERAPTAPPGNRWADAKVLGGAEIAAALGPAWAQLRLQRIVPSAADPAVTPASRPQSGRRSGEPFFTLVTRGGTRVLWGYAPGANALGELSPTEKLARLQRYMSDHDTLEGREGKPQVLDVRTMRPSM